MTDLWKGKPLTTATEVIWVHYRIHDAATGEVVSFGSNAGEAALEETVKHLHALRAKHEGRRLVLRHYDKPAYLLED